MTMSTHKQLEIIKENKDDEAIKSLGPEFNKMPCLFFLLSASSCI